MKFLAVIIGLALVYTHISAQNMTPREYDALNALQKWEGVGGITISRRISSLETMVAFLFMINVVAIVRK